MAITRNPSVDVCLHRSLRWIVLVHTAHTIDTDGMFRGNLPWGQEEKFGLGEFEQRGRELIENSLAAFPFRDGVPDSEVGSFTKLKWRELLKDHRVVSIGHSNPASGNSTRCIISASAFPADRACTTPRSGIPRPVNGYFTARCGFRLAPPNCPNAAHRCVCLNPPSCRGMHRVTGEILPPE